LHEEETVAAGGLAVTPSLGPVEPRLVRDAFGRIQSLLLLGGASEIGLAIAERMVADGCRTVVLAGRHPDAMEAGAVRLRSAGAESVDTVHWDALEPAAHAAAIDAAFAKLGGRDLDAVVLASGVLGDQAAFDADPASGAAAVAANFGGAVSIVLDVAGRMREQGQGTIVVLSSVAGERVRKANFVYGASKAGLDAFAQGLADDLVGTGVRVLIVRPGFVHTRMTEGMQAAPFATTADAVAAAVASALARGREVIWVPGVLRFVFAVFRHLPRPLWRKVSAAR
jgi:decaprenylphospho-beta-D-erythro-pentofuranosid-2-ulose 2-reductase